MPWERREGRWRTSSGFASKCTQVQPQLFPGHYTQHISESCEIDFLLTQLK